MIDHKYQIGQEVFAARYEPREVEQQCPDCLGRKQWSVETPTGEKFEIPCGTCGYAYGCFASGVVKVPKVFPIVLTLTVGSIRIDTDDKESPVGYMCLETGVGSGTIWNEADLFVDRTKAQAKADKLAAQETRVIEDRAEFSRQEERKKQRRKPSWEKRKIKELETELKELRKMKSEMEKATSGQAPIH